MGLGGFLKKLFGGGAPEPRPAAVQERARERAPEPTSRLGLADLASRLEMRESTLEAFRPAYREFQIRKRGGGTRHIAASTDATRDLQRRLLRRVLGGYRAHACATGFERGYSIVINALPHVKRAVVVRMDLQDFFPSTGADRIERWFRFVGWDDAATEVLVRLTTHRDGLPQGAPTSPRLSNLVNHGIDVRLAALAASFGAAYTRYADDLTFSFATDRPRRVGRLIRLVKEIVGESGYRLHHRKKLRIRRAHQQQVVTGIVVNERPNLPRALRRKLRAAEHRKRTGKEPTFTEAQLDGWRALQSMVEKQREAGD